MLTKRILPSMLCLFLLMSCGGKNKSSNSNNVQTTPPSVKNALIQLETTGATPLLDRSPTVQGIDSNANNIRDDVENYVSKLPDNTSQKKALLSTSKAINSAMLVSLSDTAGVRSATDQINQAVECIWEKYPSDVANQKLLEIRKITVNTKLRYDAYMAFNKSISGIVVKAPKGVLCD